jgi:hypothetical protein
MFFQGLKYLPRQVLKHMFIANRNSGDILVYGKQIEPNP